MISKKTFLSNRKKLQKKKVKMKQNHLKNHLFLMMMKMKIFHSSPRQKLQTNKSHKILIKLFIKLKKLNQKSNKSKNLQSKNRKIHCLVEFNKYRKIVLLERRHRKLENNKRFNRFNKIIINKKHNNKRNCAKSLVWVVNQ